MGIFPKGVKRRNIWNHHLERNAGERGHSYIHLLQQNSATTVEDIQQENPTWDVEQIKNHGPQYCILEYRHADGLAWLCLKESALSQSNIAALKIFFSFWGPAIFCSGISIKNSFRPFLNCSLSIWAKFQHSEKFKGTIGRGKKTWNVHFINIWGGSTWMSQEVRIKG